MNQTTLPVHLIWDRPNVDSVKHGWNYLDHLMPLHSCQQKNNKWGLPTMSLMSEHFGSLSIIPKEVMQTCLKRGVLIEQLEPDGSDKGWVTQSWLIFTYRAYCTSACNTLFVFLMNITCSHWRTLPLRGIHVHEVMNRTKITHMKLFMHIVLRKRVRRVVWPCEDQEYAGRETNIVVTIEVKVVKPRLD